MADRGRDLKFSILSDVAQFDTDKPAKGLEDLGDAADAAGRRLDDLDDAQRQQVDSLKDMIDAAKRGKAGIEDLGDGAEKGERSLDDLGDESRKTASKVDDAFDKIARSSKAGAQKVDTATDKIEAGFDGVKDEALDTGREMAASFGGGVDDILDAGQELLANAGQVFGPAGIAIGIALASGFALFRAEQEKMKENVTELTDLLIEGAGKIERESVLAKLAQFNQDGTLDKLAQSAKDANINVDDFLLALAGDQDALARTTTELERVDARLKDMDLSMAGTDPTMVTFFNGVKAVREELGTQSDALSKAKERYDIYNGAAQKAGETAVTAADNSGAAWDDLRSNLGKPIRAQVTVDAPSAAEIDAINRAIRRGIGTIVVPVKAGQSRFANTSSNSRYRE